MLQQDSTRKHAAGDVGTIEPAVGNLIRQLFENDARRGPATEADEVILDIEIGGIRYLGIRCAPRPARPSSPAPEASPDSTRPEPGPSLGLSPRECEIARMVAKGYPNKSIASVLDISSWTVSSHLRRIFTKLGVTSRAAMVARLLDEGQRSAPPSSGQQRAGPTLPKPGTTDRTMEHSDLLGSPGGPRGGPRLQKTS